MEERTANDDPTRIATLKAHYNSLVQSLKGAGFRELQGSKPDLESPVKDRTIFRISGKSAEGVPSYICSITAFGKNVYLFQVFAETREEAEQLAKVTEGLKEEKQNKN